MEKTIRINLQKDGKLTVIGSDESLGFQSETKATKIVFTLPKNLESGLTHYVEFLAPSGESKSTAPLEKHVEPADNSDYIEVLLQTPLIQEAGRYLVQYVGRNTETGKVVKSEIIALDVEESINAGNNMSDDHPDWIAYATEILDSHERRLKALEDDESAEVHADGTGTRDGEIIVKDSSGTNKIKGSGKTLEEVHNDAVNASVTTAESIATTKVASETSRATQAEEAIKQRVKALEDDESGEVKASQNFGSDGIIIVSDGAGKSVKAGTKSIAGILSAAGEDATQKVNAAKTEVLQSAGLDATAKANLAKQEAIQAADSDATSKASTAKAEAVAEAKAYTDSKQVIVDLELTESEISSLWEAN